MKVVLFCGGLGTRLREHSERIPKPLVNIGHRPILWHLMRYYAHFGHKDFILCLGYRGDLIREFFLNYNECLSNDFVLSGGGRKIELLSSDVHDWRITFVDTGLNANIGQRLLRVRQHLAGEKAFLANYSDGLSDVPLNRQISDFERRGVTASFVAVRPSHSFHGVQSDNDGLVTAFGAIRDAGFSINARFFCLRADIFEHIKDGDELVEQPFQRLIARRQLALFRHDGFWQPMDTFKDKMAFDSMDARGEHRCRLWQAPDRCTMLKLDLGINGRPLRLLCLGAHSDDLEIGCAGTVLEWLSTYPRVEVTWVVMSASEQRAAEAHRSANALLKGASRKNVVFYELDDGHFPAHFAEAKKAFEDLKATEKPDVIFSHRLEDRHQDHRLVAELTWQTWRSHLILEYEVPKYEGDLGQPNLFVPVSARIGKRKVDHLMRHFASQRSRNWFSPPTFFGLMHLRGLECRAPSGFAEAHHMRKAVL